MSPSAVLRFRNRGTGIYPAEPIAVPRTLSSLQFSELIPKLLAEFWPAVRDDAESVGDAAVCMSQPQNTTAPGIPLSLCARHPSAVRAGRSKQSTGLRFDWICFSSSAR